MWVLEVHTPYVFHHKLGGAGSDNIGHKLLQKMGWKEGQGLGSSQAATAITAPVTVGVVFDGFGASSMHKSRVSRS